MALLGNIGSPDKELNEALQPVISIMHEKYRSGVLIVKSIGADLYFGKEESHYFNKKMLEEFLQNPKQGLTNEFFAAIKDI